MITERTFYMFIISGFVILYGAGLISLSDLVSICGIISFIKTL